MYVCMYVCTTRAGPVPRATRANVTSLRIAANIQNHRCNCDSNGLTWREDSDYLTDKYAFSVSEVRFQDTGSNAKDNKKILKLLLVLDQGRYKKGPLSCCEQHMYVHFVYHLVTSNPSYRLIPKVIPLKK